MKLRLEYVAKVCIKLPIQFGNWSNLNRQTRRIHVLNNTT